MYNNNVLKHSLNSYLFKYLSTTVFISSRRLTKKQLDVLRKPSG